MTLWVPELACSSLQLTSATYTALSNRRQIVDVALVMGSDDSTRPTEERRPHRSPASRSNQLEGVHEVSMELPPAFGSNTSSEQS